MAMLVAVTSHSYSWMAMLGAGTSWTCPTVEGKPVPPGAPTAGCVWGGHRLSLLVKEL